MDSLPPLISNATAWPSRQHTLKAAISCVGTGLHSGCRVHVTLAPAPAGHGVVFHRTDTGAEVDARFDRVADCRLATTLGTAPDGADRVGTVEHLMAALLALHADNVRVELDGPELPILDGSAGPWLFLLDCAGVVGQDAPQRTIEVLRRVRVGDAYSWAELLPAKSYQGLDLSAAIAFGAAAIGTQALSLRLTQDSFRQELARARTFTLAGEIEGLRAAGLARGGSLENAVVVDDGAVLNPGGLRMADEFVRHKLLDAVGDLALAGAPLVGRFRGHRSGHALHNQLLQALFADAINWRERIAPAAPATAVQAAA